MVFAVGMSQNRAHGEGESQLPLSLCNQLSHNSWLLHVASVPTELWFPNSACRGSGSSGPAYQLVSSSLALSVSLPVLRVCEQGENPTLSE